MKRIAPTLALLFLLCSTNGQDILSGPSVWNLDLYETENTENLNSDRKTKIHFLFTPHFTDYPSDGWFTACPFFIPAGIQVSILRKWGGYISSAFTPRGMNYYFLNIGAVRQLTPLLNIYAGGSKMPRYYISHGSLSERNQPFGIEAGVILNLKTLSLAGGLGSSIINNYKFPSSDPVDVVWSFNTGEILFAKLGIGINF